MLLSQSIALKNRTCKKRAREEPEEKASNIIINVLKKDPLDIMPNEFESIRQSLYQERRKQYPKCPTSIEDTRTALESGTFNAPAEMVFAFRNDVGHGNTPEQFQSSE
ncbi:hypothetical protein RRG08_014123 [Elysia crispata]|uniref:Uncharacterized protein n=1 Tax=Elysia crispata TaxID=231223 RepID=A0AAE1ALE3_9GAST|nr:hypothetical protein RRG08_014123 [Elysia crispata]